MGLSDRLVVSAIFTLLSVASSLGRITLNPMKSVYLPFTFSPTPEFGFDKNASKRIAYDPDRKLVFTVGNANLFVLDAGPAMRLDVLAQIEVAGPRTFTDVTFCGGYILTTMRTDDNKFTGAVKIFSYNQVTKVISLDQTVAVGSQPAMVTATRDCRTVLVALEGSAFVNADDQIVDPEGGVGVVAWNPNNPSVTPLYREVDFKTFNAQVFSLTTRGVRFVYRENGNTLSQDLEPQYISLSSDETKAYVALQENNAIAVLDISDPNNPMFKALHPLPTKRWDVFGLDSSSADKGINIIGWPVFGVLQPSAIHTFRHSGEEYIAVANEGSPKTYTGRTGTFFSELKTGKMLVAENLIAESVNPALKNALGDDTRLGSLQFSTVTASNITTGKFERLTALGGRSFAIIRTSDMQMLFESGSSLEHTIADAIPRFFNSNPISEKRPEETLENRSSIRGPEPESIAVGEVSGKVVIFVGSEHPGTISVYSLATNTLSPQFESVYFGADMRPGETWGDAYAARRTGDLEPEDLIFSPAPSNSMARPMLFVSGKKSGTVTAYEVVDDGQAETITPQPTVSARFLPTTLSRFQKSNFTPVRTGPSGRSGAGTRAVFRERLGTPVNHGPSKSENTRKTKVNGVNHDVKRFQSAFRPLSTGQFRTYFYIVKDRRSDSSRRRSPARLPVRPKQSRTGHFSRAARHRTPSHYRK